MDNSLIPDIDCSAIMQKNLENVVRSILTIVQSQSDETQPLNALPSLSEIKPTHPSQKTRFSFSSLWKSQKDEKVEGVTIKEPLQEAKETDNRHIKIRFRADHSKVVLCDVLKKLLKTSNSVMVDIILDKYFWNLSIRDDGFSVILLFGEKHNGVRQAVFVPFSSITHFFYGDHFDIQMIPHED